MFYSELEKIAYAVVMSSCKLRHYFEAHKIHVITNQPSHDLFHNREASARICNWALKLSEFVVYFERRTAIESQVTSLGIFHRRLDLPSAQEEAEVDPWTIYCDGAWNNKGMGILAIF